MAGWQFYSDIDLPDQYYGALVRSSIQRGHLLDIKPPPMPDGYFLYTATDIPGENRLTTMGTSIPIFTPYEIQYLGEPVGIVVGPDQATVHKLASAVHIEAESLEPYSFSEKFASTQVVGKRIIFSGDSDAIFEQAEKIYESTSTVGPQDHFYAEPLGVVVFFEEGKLEVYTATQWPFHVRSSIASVLDMDPKKIVVTPTSTGEAMDGKIWFPSLLAAQAALAAMLCQKPIKLVFSRKEDFHFSVKSAPVQIRYRTALSNDGSITAMHVRILVNAGAYSPLIDEIIDRMTVTATGFYSVASFRIETYALRTSMPPMGAFSGWGEAQVLFALETHIASLISSLDVSPVEWKLMNTLDHGCTTINNHWINGNFRLMELFDIICSVSDYPRKYTAYSYLNSKRHDYRDGPLRGIGIVCGFQGNGFIGKTSDRIPYSVEMTMETDGQLHIKTGVCSPVMENIIQKIAAKVLGIEETLISFTGINTETMTVTGPETLSNKISIMVPLVEKCCTTIQKQRFRKPLPITVKKTYKPGKKEIWDSQTLKGKPFVSVTPGVCAVELELDPITYETNILGIWIACDAGTILDRNAAIGTIHKTVPVALSRILSEDIIIEEGSFSLKNNLQYDMLPPPMIPETMVKFLDSGDSPCGIGSIVHNLLPAAYAIALAQILGQQVETIPADTRMVYTALESKGKTA